MDVGCIIWACAWIRCPFVFFSFALHAMHSLQLHKLLQKIFRRPTIIQMVIKFQSKIIHHFCRGSVSNFIFYYFELNCNKTGPFSHHKIRQTHRQQWNAHVTLLLHSQIVMKMYSLTFNFSLWRIQHRSPVFLSQMIFFRI